MVMAMAVKTANAASGGICLIHLKSCIIMGTNSSDGGPLHLAGSGPAVYYLSDDEDELIDIADQKNTGNDEIKKYIARTVP